MFNAASREEAKKKAARAICTFVKWWVKDAIAEAIADHNITATEKQRNLVQGELLLEVGAQLFSAGMGMIRDSEEGVDND